jgi:hypothetical protein
VILEMPLLRREKPLNAAKVPVYLPEDKYVLKRSDVHPDLQEAVGLLKTARRNRDLLGAIGGAIVAGGAIAPVAFKTNMLPISKTGAMAVMMFGGTGFFGVADALEENDYAKQCLREIGVRVRKTDFIKLQGGQAPELQEKLRSKYKFFFVKQNGDLLFTNKEHGFKLLGLKMGRKREALQ